MAERQIVYVIEPDGLDLKIVPKRTRNPEKLQEKLGRKVYLKERFAKTALTRLYDGKQSKPEAKAKTTSKAKTASKRKSDGNPRVRIFIIEDGKVVPKRTRNPSQFEPYFTTQEEAEAANVFDYTLTRHSVSVVLGGESETIIPTDPRYNKIRKACIEGDVKTVGKLCALDRTISNETKGVFKTKERGRKVLIDGQELPKALADKIGRLMKDKQPTEAFMAFWNRLKKNPDKRVRENLYEFIAKVGCALTTDGFILAYKYVNSNYTSCHGGKFDWTPGKRVRERRAICDSNPKNSCSTGLHTGSHTYVGNYGSIRLLVKIDPKDVVSVPYDYNCEKMRCCCVYSVCHADSPLKQELVDAKDVAKWTGQKKVAYHVVRRKS